MQGSKCRALPNSVPAICKNIEVHHKYFLKMPRELQLQNTAKSPSSLVSNIGLNPPKNQAPAAPKLLTIMKL